LLIIASTSRSAAYSVSKPLGCSKVHAWPKKLAYLCMTQ